MHSNNICSSTSCSFPTSFVNIDIFHSCWKQLNTCVRLVTPLQTHSVTLRRLLCNYRHKFLCHTQYVNHTLRTFLCNAAASSRSELGDKNLKHPHGKLQDQLLPRCFTLRNLYSFLLQKSVYLLISSHTYVSNFDREEQIRGSG